MPGRQPHPCRFTLLELVIATVASAVLVAALLAALAGAWRLQDQGQRLEMAAVPREAAAAVLARDLRLAVAPSGVMAGPLTAVSSSSGGDRLDDVEWVTAIGGTNAEVGGGDLVQVRYVLEPADVAGSFRLLRHENRNLLAVQTDDAEGTPILEGVVSFAVNWYDGSTWRESWDSTAEDNALPEAAHVRIDFAATAGVAPLPLEMMVPFVVRTTGATEVQQ